MNPSDHPTMIQNGPIRMCAARECAIQANALANHFEDAGITFSSASESTPCKALVLLVSPQTSYEKLRASIVSAMVQRAPIILVKMAPAEIPEDAREALQNAVVVDAATDMKEVTNDVIRALARCGALLQKPTLPIRPLP
jgi:hypothetical protein